MNKASHTRSLKRGVGSRNLGTTAKSFKANAKAKPIEHLQVFKSNDNMSVVVVTIGDDRSQSILTLTPVSALEVVKGILMNIDPLHTAADDELLSIIKQAEASADAEAKAIRQVFKDRLSQV